MRTDDTFRMVAAKNNQAAYIYMPGHPGAGKTCVAKTIAAQLPEGADIFDINFDFDKAGKIIGIEILK